MGTGPRPSASSAISPGWGFEYATRTEYNRGILGLSLLAKQAMNPQMADELAKFKEVWTYRCGRETGLGRLLLLHRFALSPRMI